MGLLQEVKRLIKFLTRAAKQMKEKTIFVERIYPLSQRKREF